MLGSMSTTEPQEGAIIYLKTTSQVQAHIHLTPQPLLFSLCLFGKKPFKDDFE